MYHLGSKNAKSGITTIDSISAKSDVNSSSQIAHKHSFEEIDAFYPFVLLKHG